MSLSLCKHRPCTDEQKRATLFWCHYGHPSKSGTPTTQVRYFGGKNVTGVTGSRRWRNNAQREFSCGVPSTCTALLRRADQCKWFAADEQNGQHCPRPSAINASGFLPRRYLALAPYSVTLLTTAGEDNQPPAAPANLQASNITDNKVTLAWTAATDNAGIAGYDLYDGSTKINASLITGTAYTAEWLNAGTAYNFTLKAFDNSELTSPASAPLSVFCAFYAQTGIGSTFSHPSVQQLYRKCGKR